MTIPKIPLLCAVAMLLCAPALAADRIMVLARDYDPADAQAIADAVGPILQNMQPGDHVTAISAATGRVIMDAKIPDEAVYAEHPQHKTKLLADPWSKLIAYLEASISDDAAPIDTEAAEQVNLPSMLGTLGYHAARAPEIAFIGNALWHDPSAPVFSMLTSYPSDALLLQAPAQNPYGTVGMQDRLPGLQVHYCVTDAQYVNTRHGAGVHRTYARLVEGYGAQLVTFTQELATCLARFAAGDASGADSFAPLDDTAAPAMITPRSQAALPDLATVQPPCGNPAVGSTPEPVEPKDPEQDVAVVTPAPDAISSTPELDQALKEQKAEMVALWLFDTDVEDGDEVDITAFDFTRRVKLTKEPQLVEVPVMKGRITIIGAVDGRGGITVGIHTPDGRTIFSKEIIVGQREDLPLGL